MAMTHRVGIRIPPSPHKKSKRAGIRAGPFFYAPLKNIFGVWLSPVSASRRCASRRAVGSTPKPFFYLSLFLKSKAITKCFTLTSSILPQQINFTSGKPMIWKTDYFATTLIAINGLRIKVHGN